MLKAKRSLVNGKVIIQLSGAIEEDDENPGWLINSRSNEAIFSTKDIQRINSAGIRNWILYFEGLVAKGIKLTFIEVPTILVQTAKLIPNFFCGAKIESFFVPLECTKCKHTFSILVKRADVKKDQKNYATPQCPECKGKSIIDDDDTYFDF